MMMKQVRQWLSRSRARRLDAMAVGVLALVVGLMLLWQGIRRPTPPDLSTASYDQMIEFAVSGDFDRLSSLQRDKLLREAAGQFMGMSAQERVEIDQRWRAANMDRQLRRRIEAQVDLALACRMADEFAALDPAMHGPFLDQMLFMIHHLKGGTKFMEWAGSNPALTVVRDPSSIQRDMGKFERKLFLGTTAEQRATMYRLGGALLERNKQRYPS